MAANEPLVAPPLAPPDGGGANPPMMSGAATYAMLVMFLFGPLYAFPTKDVELQPFNNLLNLAVVLAASVIVTEVNSLLVLVTEKVKNRIDSIKRVAMFISMALIILGFIFFALDKINKKSTPLRFNNLRVRPVTAVIWMLFGGSRSIAGDLLVAVKMLLRFISNHQLTSLLVLSVAMAAGTSIFYNYLAEEAVLV